MSEAISLCVYLSRFCLFHIRIKGGQHGRRANDVAGKLLKDCGWRVLSCFCREWGMCMSWWGLWLGGWRWAVLSQILFALYTVNSYRIFVSTNDSSPLHKQSSIYTSSPLIPRSGKKTKLGALKRGVVNHILPSLSPTVTQITICSHEGVVFLALPWPKFRMLFFLLYLYKLYYSLIWLSLLPSSPSPSLVYMHMPTMCQHARQSNGMDMKF